MTTRSSSYIAETDVRPLEIELDRLRQQVELSWRKERRILSQLPIPEGGEILDLGCGPGFFSERLAAEYPHASITGLDASASLLERARQRVGAEENRRIRFVEAVIPDAAWETGRFDVVVCRYVLQHLTDPSATVAAIFRMLKPGGHAVLIDVDADLLGVSVPANVHLADIYRRAGLIQARLGGNRTIGRFLFRFLALSGFRDVTLSVLPLHSDEIEMRCFEHQMRPDLLQDALVNGLISPGEHAFVCSEYERFLAAPEGFVLMLLFVATGQRP